MACPRPDPGNCQPGHHHLPLAAAAVAAAQKMAVTVPLPCAAYALTAAAALHPTQPAAAAAVLRLSLQHSGLADLAAAAAAVPASIPQDDHVLLHHMKEDVGAHPEPAQLYLLLPCLL